MKNYHSVAFDTYEGMAVYLDKHQEINVVGVHRNGPEIVVVYWVEK
jgi:hypothetical protein